MRRFLKLLRPYAGLLALSLLMVIVSNAMQLVLPQLTVTLSTKAL